MSLRRVLVERSVDDKIYALLVLGFCWLHSCAGPGNSHGETPYITTIGGTASQRHFNSHVDGQFRNRVVHRCTWNTCQLSNGNNMYNHGRSPDAPEETRAQRVRDALCYWPNDSWPSCGAPRLFQPAARSHSGHQRDPVQSHAAFAPGVPKVPTVCEKTSEPFVAVLFHHEGVPTVGEGHSQKMCPTPSESIAEPICRISTLLKFNE